MYRVPIVLLERLVSRGPFLPHVHTTRRIRTNQLGRILIPLARVKSLHTGALTTDRDFSLLTVRKSQKEKKAESLPFTEPAYFWNQR